MRDTIISLSSAIAWSHGNKQSPEHWRTGGPRKAVLQEVFTPSLSWDEGLQQGGLENRAPFKCAPQNQRNAQSSLLLGDLSEKLELYGKSQTCHQAADPQRQCAASVRKCRFDGSSITARPSESHTHRVPLAFVRHRALKRQQTGGFSLRSLSGMSASQTPGGAWCRLRHSAWK